MTTLVHELEMQHTITKEPLRMPRTRRPVERAAMLTRAHKELAGTMSPDPVQFLEQHRQLSGE